MLPEQIKILRAGYGDSIILQCRKGDNKGIIVIDGGYSGNAKFNEFINEVENYESIDLMIMTHIDDDHLVGIKKYIEDHVDDDPFPVKELWVNCAMHIPFDLNDNLSPDKAKSLADTLVKLSTEQNAKWEDYICDGHDTAAIEYAEIDVINPTMQLLQTFIEKLKDEVNYGAIEEKEVNLANEAKNEGIKDIDIPMPELAKRIAPPGDPKVFRELTNMVSISCIVKTDDFSILLLGDSYPKEIYEALVNRGYNVENKLKVDYVKVAHHGSFDNTSNDLLDIIDCDNYIISTNGARGYRHPHRETLAHILCHPQRDYSRPVNFYFSYPLSDIVENSEEEKFNEELDIDLNYVCNDPISD